MYISQLSYSFISQLSAGAGVASDTTPDSEVSIPNLTHTHAFPASVGARFDPEPRARRFSGRPSRHNYGGLATPDGAFQRIPGTF